LTRNKKRPAGKPKRRAPRRPAPGKRSQSKPRQRQIPGKKRTPRRRIRRRPAHAALMAPRQVAVRAQETAFQLLVAVDRGGVIHRFLRWYANERKRPGRISNPWRYRDLVETIRRESFLVLALQVEAEAPQRLGARPAGKLNAAVSELVHLFREEFYVALGRSLDFSDDEFNDFCRDLEIYRGLRTHGLGSQSRANALAAPAGPFVDRCGFLLDSPMLDQARRAAAKFEGELHATASTVLRRVFSRRAYL
jgi:hypothetical protein